MEEIGERALPLIDPFKDQDEVSQSGGCPFYRDGC
jgi:hypothetical protein